MKYTGAGRSDEGAQRAEPAGREIFVLLETARQLQARLEAALEAAGLSPAKYAALAQLAQSGEPMTLGELAGCLNCVRSNVTQLADRLEADGLVERVDDPSDRRAIRARMTRLGAERYGAAQRAIRGVEQELAARVAPEDRAAMQRVLSSLG